MVTEQHLYWYKKLYENKEKDYLELLKKKIDLNQSPGKKF